MLAVPICALLFFFNCLFFWPHHKAYGILVPWPGIEPSPPCIGRQRLNYWTTGEVPMPCFLMGAQYSLVGVNTQTCLWLDSPGKLP